jgi:hypothetical protein
MRARAFSTLLAAVIGALTAGACGRGNPPPQAPSTEPSTTPVRVIGTEKIVWDQSANNPAQFGGYRYIVYIDDVPVDLADVACSPASPNPTFSCSAALPKMLPGAHRLQLVTQETDGQRRRSPKSGALRLDVARPNTSP